MVPQEDASQKTLDRQLYYLFFDFFTLVLSSAVNRWLGPDQTSVSLHLHNLLKMNIILNVYFLLCLKEIVQN